MINLRKRWQEVPYSVREEIFLFSCWLALSAAALHTPFSPYVGQQQKTGIRQPASYVKVVDKANLYMPGQFPGTVPDIILGSVTTDNEQNIAKAVHEQHADAALV